MSNRITVVQEVYHNLSEIESLLPRLRSKLKFPLESSLYRQLVHQLSNLIEDKYSDRSWDSKNIIRTVDKVKVFLKDNDEN